MATGRITIEGVFAALLAAGFIADGHTESETVRIPTRNCPVYGGIGGELATFGGRKRFRRGEQFVTVGKRTICFYEKRDRKAYNFRSYPTNAREQWGKEIHA